MFEHFYKPYKIMNGLQQETDAETITYTGLFNLLRVSGLDTLISAIPFITGLTETIIDDYLNTTLRDCLLCSDFSGAVTYDSAADIWKLEKPEKVRPLANTLYTALLKEQKIVDVMTQTDLNILQYADIDTDVYGEKSRDLSFGRVEVTLNNGPRVNTISNGQKTRTHESGDDITTRQIAGFNSSGFSDAEKTTFQEGTYTDTDSASTDTSTDSASTDTSTTAARSDSDILRTYTDTHTHTRHYILSPELYFQIQKEMAQFGIYSAIGEAVRNTFCIDFWEV